MFLILFILNNPDQTEQILEAWEKAGVSGVTIIPSTGLGHYRQKIALREDFPIIPSLTEFFEHEEDQHRTLFTVVDDHGMVEKILAATQAITGDLEKPDNGILFVLPVLEAYGIRPRSYPIHEDPDR
jgi:nitrogen regulatory protein PII